MAELREAHLRYLLAIYELGRNDPDKGFVIWFLSTTSRKGTLFTCNPPGIQNDTAYGERYQIVIKRGA